MLFGPKDFQHFIKGYEFINDTIIWVRLSWMFSKESLGNEALIYCSLVTLGSIKEHLCTKLPRWTLQCQNVTSEDGQKQCKSVRNFPESLCSSIIDAQTLGGPLHDFHVMTPMESLMVGMRNALLFLCPFPFLLPCWSFSQSAFEHTSLALPPEFCQKNYIFPQAVC